MSSTMNGNPPQLCQPQERPDGYVEPLGYLNENGEVDVMSKLIDYLDRTSAKHEAALRAAATPSRGNFSPPSSPLVMSPGTPPYNLPSPESPLLFPPGTPRNFSPRAPILEPESPLPVTPCSARRSPERGTMLPITPVSMNLRSPTPLVGRGFRRDSPQPLCVAASPVLEHFQADSPQQQQSGDQTQIVAPVERPQPNNEKRDKDKRAARAHLAARRAAKRQRQERRESRPRRARGGLSRELQSLVELNGAGNFFKEVIALERSNRRSSSGMGGTGVEGQQGEAETAPADESQRERNGVKIKDGEEEEEDNGPQEGNKWKGRLRSRSRGMSVGGGVAASVVGSVEIEVDEVVIKEEDMDEKPNLWKYMPAPVAVMAAPGEGNSNGRTSKKNNEKRKWKGGRSRRGGRK